MNYPAMIRKFLVISMAFGLSVSTFACADDSTALNSTDPAPVAATQSAAPAIADGSYPVQQATYDDGSGEYTLMLLDTPAGTPPLYRATDLQMARLTDAEIKAGQKPYLRVENAQPVLYLSEDFRIEYVHNVVETQTNPQTGQEESVVVRRESNFWSPFAGALAGQAVGNLLFAPRYYVPPIYSPGRVMTGYGGYGSSYSDAVSSYRTKYNAPPAAVKNQQSFRTTGQLRRSPNPVNSTTTKSPSKSPSVNSGNRSTGSGYGSTDLQRSKTRPSRTRSSGSFGSGGARRRSGGRRR
ncbi:hypothetical protein [Rivularia sp. UHCC 0363]|uniref:hypothetical protein n=1 Tax=Rivularia sp. UHCC 0363 TaxID=3110244 RepID=UPI002B20B58C|nr:hypothetical protein [Rivularia sp. UHCC 0363]MEA5597447.1 hypothetical protein [Rivularia sp. UHCC 0363]